MQLPLMHFLWGTTQRPFEWRRVSCMPTGRTGDHSQRRRLLDLVHGAQYMNCENIGSGVFRFCMFHAGGSDNNLEHSGTSAVGRRWLISPSTLGIWKL